jgi:tetratricopeptide (TPR) repeat protein
MDGIFGLWWIILLVIFIIRSYGKEQPVSNPSPALCDATLHVQGLWRTVKDIERRQGKNSIELATHLRSLADIHFAKGELPEAEALIHRVLTVQKSNLPADSPDMFGTLACLTNIAAAQGNHDAAVDLVRTRISIVEESTPHHDSASIRASLYNELAILLHKKGKCTEAVEAFGKAVACREGEAAGDDRQVAVILYNLAMLLLEEHRAKEAEGPLQRAENILEKVIVRDSIESVADIVALADIRAARENYDGAVILLREALEILDKQMPPNDATH